ncbi:MAG: glycosyltransferase [Planctomycetota bacterium]|nr:MAG: glycosyltransferase [Planctomycetota bacterium]
MDSALSTAALIGIGFALIYAVAMTLLASQGLHLLWMLLRWTRHRRAAYAIEAAELTAPLPPDHELPQVLVQIPVFNERDMVEGVLQAVAALDWPRDRLSIQLLDDSTDDSIEVGRAAIARLQAEGVDAQWLHRADRVGFKAGALAAGMEANAAPFIAIFDADFLPEADFLRRAIKPLLTDAGLALVQGRWEHLNRRQNRITCAQAVGIDAHFAIEQSARAWSGLAMNFNGTCGLWRRQAIIDGGGWEHDTLTEDMDLSYRVQLAGWRCTYRVGLAVPGELPHTLPAFMQQQFRWAKGSIQTARKLLGRIWRSDWGFDRKLASTMHLCHYLVHPLMLIAMFSAPPAVWLTPALPVWMWWAGAAIFLIGAGAPILTYIVGQFALSRGNWTLLLDIPRIAALGTGIAINNARACFEALRGKVSPFQRTPKGKSARSVYRIGARLGLWELLAGCWAAAGILIATFSDRSWIAPVLLIYANGLLSVGSMLCAAWISERLRRPAAPEALLASETPS